jgi:hypothetical protein
MCRCTKLDITNKKEEKNQYTYLRVFCSSERYFLTFPRQINFSEDFKFDEENENAGCNMVKRGEVKLRCIRSQ